MSKKEELKDAKPEVKVEPIEAIKKPTDYFKVVDLTVEATKNANPSILDNLGIYRGPVFVALVSFFVLNMLGWSFVASLVGMGLIAMCVIHKLLHMGGLKEKANESIDSAVEFTKEKLKKKKADEAVKPEQEKK